MFCTDNISFTFHENLSVLNWTNVKKFKIWKRDLEHNQTNQNHHHHSQRRYLKQGDVFSFSNQYSRKVLKIRMISMNSLIWLIIRFTSLSLWMDLSASISHISSALTIMEEKVKIINCVGFIIFISFKNVVILGNYKFVSWKVCFVTAYDLLNARWTGETQPSCIASVLRHEVVNVFSKMTR